jgi:hypothetical protein
MRLPLVILVAAMTFAAAPGPAQDGAASQPASAQSPAQKALTAAQQGRQVAFILFWKEDNSATQAVRQTLDAALARRAGRGVVVPVQVGDRGEKAIVDRFAVSRSPMPMVVALAPNGAITGGFPLKLTEDDVAVSFVSSGMAECLKAAQAKKLVLLVVRPAGEAQDLPAGVAEMKRDPQYGPATEVVTVRADDPAEQGLLATFQVTPRKDVTVTVILAPSGQRVARFDGPFSRDQVVEKLKAASSGCCPGGKCGPDGKCG